MVAGILVDVVFSEDYIAGFVELSAVAGGERRMHGL